MRLLAVVCLLAAATAACSEDARRAAPPNAAPPGAPSRDAPADAGSAAPHFRVICDFDDARAANDARAAAEAAWKRFADLFGAPPVPRERPTIRLYGTAAAYAEAERATTAGRFAANLAFAHRDTLTAHVAVAPRMTLAAVAAAGLPPQTRRVIAHEAVHLARFAATPGATEHPGWLADGLALWISADIARAERWSAPLEEDPTDATRIGRVQRLLAAGRAPGAEALLADRTADLAVADRYALRHLWFRHLMEGAHGPALRDAFRDSFREPPGAAGTSTLAQRVAAILPGRTHSALDAGFLTAMRQLRPRWDERSRGLAAVGADWLQSAAADADAVCWRLGDATPARVSGTLRHLPSESAGAASILLARGEHGCVAVTFDAGGVAIERVTEHGERTPIASANSAVAVAETTFRIDVTGTHIAVECGDTRLVCDSPALADGSGWGLAVRAGSTVIWRALHAEPRR